MSVTNPVRKTTLYVVKNAKHVKINKEKIKELAKKWAKGKLSIPPWPENEHLHAKDDETTLTYLILLDALNFCFWPARLRDPHPKKWSIKYKGKKYDGYFGLSVALKKFFNKYPEKANFNYLKNITYKEFVSIFNGGEHLQFLKKRWQITRKISSFLLKKYDGNPKKFILSANHKLSILIPKIAKELYSFNDESRYRDKKIYIWKRAQILAIDILGTFNNKGVGYFKDPEYATAFADYKIPQILYTLGILEYSPALTKKISARGKSALDRKNKKLISAGSKEEVEIRATTIWAVEYLAKEIKKLGKNIYPYQIDWVLWNKSQDEKMALPHHLTKTFYY